jgi:DNA-binding CsgD family transcriptional regulator
MEAENKVGLPQPPESITPDQQRAAVELVTLSAAGELTVGTLRELGSTVIRYDLDAPVWKLMGWEEPRPLRAGTGIAAMALAVGAVFQPQRVRLGEQWVKDGEGRVAKITPATSLGPAHLAQWLRRRCFAEVEADVKREAEEERGGNFEESEDGWWRLAHASVSEFAMRGAVHPCSPAGLRGDAFSPGDLAAEEFLAALAAEKLTARERQVLRLHLDGCGELEIAALLRCCDRTVRRDLGSIKEKARHFSASSTWSPATMTHEGLRKITRPMTGDEWADHCAGYPASKYRRRKERLAEVVPVVSRAAAVARQPAQPEEMQAA